MKTLEQRLAAAEEAVKVLQIQSDARAAMLAGADKEIQRLREIEAEYRKTPSGKKAADLAAAAVSGELKIGMTIDQVKRAGRDLYLMSEDQFGATYRIPGESVSDGSFSYICRFENKVLVSFDREFYHRPRLRPQIK